MALNTIIINLKEGMIERRRIYISIFINLGILAFMSIEKRQTRLGAPDVKIIGKQF